MIEVRNLVKRYGPHTAVDHLSFTVEQGQIYGFLGPNGAGKSTTMNIMTGYLAATEGQVLIDGCDIFEDPEAAKRNIGYLPELPPLYLDMFVEEYLFFVADLKGIEKAKRKQYVEEVLELTHITHVRHRLIRNLSKGYRQRVGLAQAVLGYPKVIILDEPTVGLDPKQIIEIRDVVKSLGKKHTVILSSHILSEISSVCDHVMIISKGKLVASDTPENLSHTLAAANRLNLTIRGSKEDAARALEGLPGLLALDWKVSAEEGAVEAELRSGKERDIREDVFRALSKADLPILRMVSGQMSLEDVFLELTGEGAAQAADAEQGEEALA